MQNIEEQALATYTRIVPLWLRYVDDTFTAVHNSTIINIDINNSNNIYFLLLFLLLLLLLLLLFLFLLLIIINEITVETSCYFRAELRSLPRRRVLSRHATLFPNKGGGALRDETKMAARPCCTVPQL